MDSASLSHCPVIFRKRRLILVRPPSLELVLVILDGAIQSNGTILGTIRVESTIVPGLGESGSLVMRRL